MIKEGVVNLEKVSNIVKRVSLFVGYSCNNDCRFCVVADKRGIADKDTKEIKRELGEAYSGGAREVVFTGGECTLREDIFDLIRFARSRGYWVIQIQTNGRTFASPDFCEKMISAGMSEFSPALHGHNAELHDSLTRRNGSFRQTVLGIYNVKKLAKGNVKILTNTVVNRHNYKFLPEIASLLIKLGVHQYQFAFAHAMGNANRFFKDIVPRKTDVLPYLKKGLDLGINRGIKVMVEAIPLCLMRGYEKYVAEFYIPPTEIRERGTVVESFEAVRRQNGKSKFEQCGICNYNDICEGPWKEYPQYYGSEEFKPIID